MENIFTVRKIHLILMFLLALLLLNIKTVHAQTCDPATGAVCPPPPVQPQPGGDPGGGDEEENKKPKDTYVQPTATFTATPTTTPTFTPTPTFTLPPRPTEPGSSSAATLPPRPTEPSPTPRDPSMALMPNLTPQPTNERPISKSVLPILFGSLGALIIIGVLWFTLRKSAGGMLDGSVRENPLINEQLKSPDGGNNFFKHESQGLSNTSGVQPSGSENFMKEVFDEDQLPGDNLQAGSKQQK